MQSRSPQERPYRSHLRPACLPCRKRKSRCKIEAHSASCLMCQVHGTECSFPIKTQASPIKGYTRPQRTHVRRDTVQPQSISDVTDYGDGVNEHSAIIDNEANVAVNAAWDRTEIPGTNPVIYNYRHDTQPQSTVLSIEETEDENHIISPAMTGDSQVLVDYLSTTAGDGCGIHQVRSRRTDLSRQVFFTAVRKRPLGFTMNANPSHSKCQVVEKLLEPWTQQLINLYFQKANICFPLLNEESFRRQYSTAKERLSPAVLSSLYAHSLVYWRSEPQLAEQRSPDVRFIWNLASEALQSELFLSPGISTIIAILLNIGGRPTTAIVGNGVRLGSAVSLAYSLGLNHDPLSWDIPQPEKMLRSLIYRLSLACGTPPHIQRSFYDVPQLKVEYQLNRVDSQRQHDAMAIFVALSELTDVLDYYLQYLYHVKNKVNIPIDSLELRLNRWVEGLGDDIRQVITRGIFLNIPGEPNLRLAYLSIKLLTHRIRMENARSKDEATSDSLANQYISIRSTAEHIVFLVQELQDEQLRDFWLPISAFAFSSTVSILLRCALETEKSPKELSKNSSIRLAWDLITALRRHRDNSGWDLGDTCLAQHAEVVEKLVAPIQSDEHSISISNTDYEDFIIPDDLLVSEMFGGF
ncbi:fungal-specific transcription factor domain-containing protein [Daldinia vernicosa]|uniref:fungal-specific transcription factor domain-containing protein n=1 Tax=Daldinia vernicosa TaxID=114800 RepID=UPI002007D2EF|nr:fungal-specific transcription factor domain-containing protein [Daldinia vernicosa]KAI0853047.1 fungal-specific transcription factor domain-containing protein [Daldinia vernicosa]